VPLRAGFEVESSGDLYISANDLCKSEREIHISLKEIRISSGDLPISLGEIGKSKRKICKVEYELEKFLPPRPAGRMAEPDAGGFIPPDELTREVALILFGLPVV